MNGQDVMVDAPYTGADVRAEAFPGYRPARRSGACSSSGRHGRGDTARGNRARPNRRCISEIDSWVLESFRSALKGGDVATITTKRGWKAGRTEIRHPNECIRSLVPARLDRSGGPDSTPGW